RRSFGGGSGRLTPHRPPHHARRVDVADVHPGFRVGPATYPHCPGRALALSPCTLKCEVPASPEAPPTTKSASFPKKWGWQISSSTQRQSVLAPLYGAVSIWLATRSR